MTQYMRMPCGHCKHISAAQKNERQICKFAQRDTKSWDLQKGAMLCFEQTLIPQKFIDSSFCLSTTHRMI